ncbi:MAG: sulfotransferase [Myxococcales bacterium]|nr:sulfotransferase [Myxococcales bacterium]
MTLTVDEFTLPWPLRGLDSALRGAERLGLRPMTLDAERLMRSASASTGLHDFGDAMALEGLRALVAALEATAELSFLGRVALRRFLTQRLESRLRVLETCARDPALLRAPVERPIFIVGLPRTGTTILQHLLAEAGGARSPRMWELLYPAPPPDPARYDDDPRVARVARELAQFHRLAPTTSKIHPLRADAPDECLMLFNHAFANFTAHTFGHIPSYHDWLWRQDMAPAYRFHRVQLQVLQRRVATTRWVLKAPQHMHALDALLAVYPDACIIQTHRDPGKTIPSICSLVGTTRQIYSRDRDMHRLGRRELEFWARGLDHAMALRERGDGSRFFDVRYQQLVADPVGVTRRVHEHFELPWRPGTEARLERFLSAYPQNAHGVHRYTAARFGLTDDVIGARLSRYRDAFSIARES